MRQVYASSALQEITINAFAGDKFVCEGGIGEAGGEPSCEDAAETDAGDADVAARAQAT